MADERSPGDSEFVEQAIRHAEEALLRRTRLKKRSYDIWRVAERGASIFVASVEEIFRGGQSRPQAKARSLFCYWATHDLGMTATELIRILSLDQSTIG
jgi:putative transposase